MRAYFPLKEKIYEPKNLFLKTFISSVSFKYSSTSAIKSPHKHMNKMLWHALFYLRYFLLFSLHWVGVIFNIH